LETLSVPPHSNLYIKQIEFDVHIAALQKQHWIGVTAIRS